MFFYSKVATDVAALFQMTLGLRMCFAFGKTALEWKSRWNKRDAAGVGITNY